MILQYGFDLNFGVDILDLGEVGVFVLPLPQVVAEDVWDFVDRALDDLWREIENRAPSRGYVV